MDWSNDLAIKVRGRWRHSTPAHRRHASPEIRRGRRQIGAWRHGRRREVLRRSVGPLRRGYEGGRGWPATLVLGGIDELEAELEEKLLGLLVSVKT